MTISGWRYLGVYLLLTTCYQGDAKVYTSEQTMANGNSRYSINVLRILMAEKFTRCVSSLSQIPDVVRAPCHSAPEMSLSLLLILYSSFIASRSTSHSLHSHHLSIRIAWLTSQSQNQRRVLLLLGSEIHSRPMSFTVARQLRELKLRLSLAHFIRKLPSHRIGLSDVHLSKQPGIKPS